ncbi:hypothetical protein RSOL_313270, partial [Rhizoctonia solani AG-3 Rhs1AP]
MDVLIESGIAEKIVCITLDNASNNNKLMEELGKEFEARGWPFDVNENRIRCFPHVMNLAVQAVLKVLPKSAAAFRDSMADENHPISMRRPRPISKRSIPTPLKLAVHRLLLVAQAGNGVRPSARSSLMDILSVLSVVHSAQELLSAEKTPTLSLAFPVYESVVQAWLDLGPKIPELGTAIGAGIGKIREYVNRTKGARVHTLAMVINPAIKFDFIHRWWSAYDRGQAYEDLRETMMKFQRERYVHTLAQAQPGAGTAAHAQNLGHLRVLNIGQTLRRASDNVDDLPENSAERSVHHTPVANTAILSSVHA